MDHERFGDLADAPHSSVPGHWWPGPGPAPVAGRPCQHYRGPDRRTRFSPPGTPTIPLVGQVAAVVVVSLVPPAFALAAGADLSLADNLLRVMTAILAIVAGVAGLVAWRVQGLAFRARFAAAMTTFGILRIAEYVLPWLSGNRTVSVDSVNALIVASVVAAIIGPGLTATAVDSGLAPLALTARCVVGGLSALCLVHLLAARAITFYGLSLPVQRDLLGTATILWVAVAGLAVRTLGGRTAVPGWAALSLVVLALGATFRAIEPSLAGGWTLLGSACTAVAAPIMMAAAVSELHLLLFAVDRTTRRLQRDWIAVREQMRADQADLEERLHDLRNTVTGLRSAHAALTEYGAALEAEARESLSAALTAELARLQRLIEPGVETTTVDFTLATVLEPVFSLERTLGADLDVEIGPLVAHGCPVGLAQVVQNLLVNARIYAPASRVRIRATEKAGRVEVTVGDDGPGVPEDERIAIFSRGWRGRGADIADGCGLGLYVAANLMTAMGGSIRLQGGPAPGACFLIELPAPPTTPTPVRAPLAASTS